MFIENAAGFTPEWSATVDERTERRQIEVQANPNRPAEYRVVTSSAAATNQSTNLPDPFEDEERRLFLQYIAKGQFLFHI